MFSPTGSRKRGFDVTKTYSGTEALKALRNKEFEVAVLDLKMEDMDGLEVLKVFQANGPSDGGHHVDRPRLSEPQQCRESKWEPTTT
jgi:CheY-like chemotaxis protein